MDLKRKRHRERGRGGEEVERRNEGDCEKGRKEERDVMHKIEMSWGLNTSAWAHFFLFFASQ